MCDILKPKNLIASKLSFSEVKTNKYGGKSVWLNYNGGKFRVQTPRMSLPYGLNEDEIKDQKTGEVIGHKYSINVSFRNMDRENDDSLTQKDRNNARRLKEFHTMLKAVDKEIMKEGVKQSMPWLKLKKADPKVVEALRNDTIRVSRDKETQEPDGKWPDTLKLKIPFWDGVFKTEVYSENKEEVDLKEYLIKGAETASLIECTGIWFAGGKFGIGWKVVQVQVLNRPTGVLGYSFLEESDDEEDDNDTSNEVPVRIQDNSDNEDTSNDVPLTHQTELDNGVQSSEEDEDEDEDEEEEDDEEEPPPPRKKSRRKN